MAVFTTEEIQDALERPQGKRAIDPTLRESDLRAINYGDFIQNNPRYLHHGIGGFAVVYRVRDTASAKEYALRCWRSATPPIGTQPRCEALNHFQSAFDSPYLVGQRFFPNALWVQGEYRPVILMDWVEGRPLREYVGDLCRSMVADQQNTGSRMSTTDLSNPMSALAKAFEEMVLDLQAQGVGHGDLQHDNIFVRKDGSLCLVDYDSIFVPGMTVDAPCPVGGVGGYGHPDYVFGNCERPSNHFLDTFAAVIIAASLHVLAATPERFDKNTTEKLLFSADDIETPESSEFVRQLKSEFTEEPIASLLSSLSSMRTDRQAAQCAFETVSSLRRAKTMPLRFVAPTLPQIPVIFAWRVFSLEQFFVS